MAAVGPAKSSSGLIGQLEKQKNRNSCKHEQPEEKETAKLLSLEEARCPVCQEIFLEPVTMPCSHSVCLSCFKQTVQFTSLRCPLCRLRVSSWVRRQSREKGLVNTKLWDLVRQSYPERCTQRIERREGGEDKKICSSFHICKSGELRQEYELQKNKMLMKEEKKRTQPHQKVEECEIPKHFQDSIGGVLSDLENEEPVGRRTRHVSAFVRKTRSSPASSRTQDYNWKRLFSQKSLWWFFCNIETHRSLQRHVVQRSRSCTDTEEGRGNDGCTAWLTAMAEACIAYSDNAGILLSSENSRSLSAPVFNPERKQSWRGACVTSSPFTAPLSKPERSISPESNDSISEELNHFKPIVCSPCTPPKRLPDGRFLEPTIVKSTPRNLSRSLQKPTSYEASPTILQKWRQIEMDRQLTKMSSRGTITSPVSEDLALKQNLVEKKSKFCPIAWEKNALKDHRSLFLSRANASGQEKGKTCNKRRLLFEQASGEQSLSVKHLAKADTPPTGLSTQGTKLAASGEPENKTGSVTEKRPAATQDRQVRLLYDSGAEVIQCQKSLDIQDQRIHANSKNSVWSRPTSRRGRKRSQKTKHLEMALRPKKSKSLSQDVFATGSDVEHLYEQCLQQERMDHELALKLQRQFNMEYKQMDRGKSSPDKYLLRSWAFADSNAEYNPRRSVRISKKS